jgi:hypothetical protein
MPLNLFLVLTSIACLTLSGGYNSGYLIFAGIFYLISLIETACSRTYAFLSHIDSADEVTAEINTLRTRPPLVHFDIQNYHYETRVRHHNGRHEHHVERINTHHAKEPFRYYEWID